MQEILDTVQPVAEVAKHVHINPEAIKTFADSINPDDLNSSEYNKENTLNDATDEQRIAYAFMYNSVNFCYWGKPKWALTSNGKELGGSASMMQALKKAVDKGYTILEPEYMANIPTADLQSIFRANVEIPLFSERLRMLHELGQGVIKYFNGSFSEIVIRANYNSADLVRLIVKSFPTVFDDHAEYHGQRVNFYKRAQLVPAHIWDLGRLELISHKISDFDELTAFADYKVPQLMRRFGILEYSENLARQVDTETLIKPGSDEEIEIRAATIWANELATQEVRIRIPDANAAKVNNVLWFKGQDKSIADKPYHKTRTVWY